MATYKHLVRKESDKPAKRACVLNYCSTNYGLGMFENHGFILGQQVLLSGFTVNPSLNGIHTIVGFPSSPLTEFQVDVTCSGLVSENGFVELFDDASFTEVYPLAFKDALFNYKKEGDTFYWSKQLSGKLSFTNRPADGVADYDYFKDIEDNSQCEKIEYILKKLCNDEYIVEWYGYFSTTDGEWDIDKCIFEVTPKEDTQFDCLSNDIDFNVWVLDRVTVRHTPETLPEELYENCILFKDILEYLVSSTCPGANGIISDFFQINPENVSTISYVTGEINPYTELVIGVKKDIKQPIPSELSTFANLSFNKLIDNFFTLLNIGWTLQEGSIRIEHESYFDFDDGLDLTQSRYDAYTAKTNKYSYNKIDVPRKETWSMMDGDTNVFIDYENACVNGSKVIGEKKYNTNLFTTNIRWVYLKPELIKNDTGFVLFATKFNSSNGYYEIRGDYNSELSLQVLVNKFFRHGRPQFGGLISYDTLLVNPDQEEFFTYSVLKNKIQKQFSIPLCCGDDFDPTTRQLTALGEGEVINASFNIKRDVLALDLAYGPDDETDIEIDDISGLQCWLRANDSTPSGDIDTWVDRSGNGNDAVQATGASQPLKTANLINGLPAIRFDGVNDFMDTPVFEQFNGSTAATQQGSIFIVFRLYGTLTTNTDFLINPASNNLWNISTKRKTTAPFTTLNYKQMYDFNQSVLLHDALIGQDVEDASWSRVMSEYGYTNFILFEMVRDGNDVLYYGNGKLQKVLATSDVWTNSLIRLGGSAINHPPQADMAEIAFYNRAVTGFERQQIERRLMSKYALYQYVYDYD